MESGVSATVQKGGGVCATSSIRHFYFGKNSGITNTSSVKFHKNYPNYMPLASEGVSKDISCA